jgi:phospholipid-binding lipoprotein MlaA
MLQCLETGAARGARRGAAGVLLAVLATLGAMPALAAEAPKDPLERLNRASYAFNDALDRMLARPAAKAYKAVVPEKARQAVSNVLGNLSYPTVIINDALQAKFSDAGSDTLRFLANTVIGVGGLFDPATRFGLPIHDEDFGQTLGAWGVPPGPYLVVPFLGPSDTRDFPSKLIDHYTAGDYWLKYGHASWLRSTKLGYGFYGARLLDRRTELLATDETLEQAFDPYVVLRNAYVARREYLVRDGNLPEETYDEPPGEAPSATPPPESQPQPPPAAVPPQAAEAP